MAAQSGGRSGNGGGAGKSKCGAPKGLPLKLGRLSPAQLAVIAALLSDALVVDSVLVDRNQDLQVVLTGTLRRKTKADKLLEQLGGLSLSDVLDSLSNR